MGLDYLSYEQALGTRLPAVSWQPGGVSEWGEQRSVAGVRLLSRA